MNKGGKIALLLLCLACVSVLTFLTSLNRDSTSGVVDGVRFYLRETAEDVRSYEFYFKEKGKIMTGTVTKTDEGKFFVLINDYGYSYDVTGENRNSAIVTPAARDDADGQPFAVFSEAMIISMVYGTGAVLSVTQSIIVSLVAIAGGIILLKQEEIWEALNKNSEKEYPENEDLRKYKIAGGIMIGAAVILLIVFVII